VPETYSTDLFLDGVYEKVRGGAALLNAVTPERAFEEKRGELRRVSGLDLLTEMFPGYTAFDKRRIVPEGTEQREGYSVVRYRAEFLPGLTGPFYMLKPDGPAREPAVLYCCGHGKGAADTVALPADEEAYHKKLPLQIVKAGYVVCIPEYIGFGELKSRNYKRHGENEEGCYANVTFLENCGLPLIGVRIFQTLFGIAFAKTLADRVVLYGISGGGMTAAFTAALTQETAGACLASYPNTFRNSVMAMRHCICNFVPGILAVGEMPEIIALAAPAPLLIATGTKDPIFPVESARTAFASIKALYDRLGAAERAEFFEFDGGHEVHGASFLEWLDRRNKDA
jgi:dienelactone hydrolase